MLTHLDEQGRIQMVDVTDKKASKRQATAVATVLLSSSAWEAASNGTLTKGELAATVKLAAIMGAKRTSELIPLTHPLNLTHVDADLDLTRPNRATITVTVRCNQATGVEMEALAGATIGSLTIYDMIKALDPEAVISRAEVTAKSGGKSGSRDRAAARATGFVLSLNRSEVKGTRKDAVESVELIQEQGMAGDAHAAGGDRQLSLLSIESFHRMADLGVVTTPGDYGENVTFAGFGYEDIRVGDGLRIGNALLVITRIGKECHSGCWIKQSVGDCVMPREGFFARILVGATIRRGDPIELLI